MDVVEAFLSSMVSHDWPALRACVTDDVTRVGPYGDTYRGRDDYVAFISELMPSLAGYRMDVRRISYLPGGDMAVAELAETVEVEGRPHVTPEVLVFGLSPDGLVRTIDIYIQTRPRRAAAVS
jgi:limonene-1,2-epoxide hydrolase